MPTLLDLKTDMQTKSTHAYGIAVDEAKTFAERKAALDPLEAEIKKLADDIKDAEHVEAARKSFLPAGDDKGPGAPADFTVPGGGAVEVKSFGQQFVESDGYKSLTEKGLKGQWTSGSIELKTLLAEGTAGVPGPGFAAVQTPQVLPGIVAITLMPLTVADLMPNGQTVSPLLRYMVETSITNAAAATAEGATKPESAIALGVVDETLHKIPTILPVTDEMLEDFAQIRSYLDGRLSLFIAHAEEANLLTGDGTGSNLVGLMNRAGKQTTIVKGTAPSVAGDNDMDAIYRQITAIRVGSFLEPDSVVIDPLGWQNIVLTKSAQGVYYAGGPFMDSANPRLWGKKVVATPRMTALTALVGAFMQAAQVFRKGGITVEATNSHNDDFAKNITHIRAEERLLLAVYRPGAFGAVTNL